MQDPVLLADHTDCQKGERNKDQDNCSAETTKPRFSTGCTGEANNKQIFSSGFMFANIILTSTDIFLQTDVITHVIVKYVDDKEIWFVRVCTKCRKQVSNDGLHYKCQTCNRIIPYLKKGITTS